MAITRKLNEINLRFDGAGNPSVTATGIVSDDAENTSTGVARSMNAPAVIAAAEQLRDAVLQVAQNAGKPLTF